MHDGDPVGGPGPEQGGFELFDVLDPFDVGARLAALAARSTGSGPPSNRPVSGSRYR